MGRNEPIDIENGQVHSSGLLYKFVNKIVTGSKNLNKPNFRTSSEAYYSIRIKMFFLCKETSLTTYKKNML